MLNFYCSGQIFFEGGESLSGGERLQGGVPAASCMIKIFYGGQGWWMRRGNSERCLKWGGGGWGRSLKNLSKKHLKKGGG